MASGEEGAQRGDERFLPAIAAMGQLWVENADAAVDSSARGAFSGDARLVFPTLGGNAELMSPALTALPGAPRLFVQGGVSAAFDPKRQVVKEGTPGTVVVPIIDSNNDGIPDPGREPPLAAVTGQGSAVESEVQPLVFTAHAGVAFSVPLGSRAFWIKPSVGYRHEETEVTTQVSAAQSIADNGLCPCRTAEFSESQTSASHWLGPALEFELDAARAGPFMLTLFLSGQAYRLVSDADVTLSATTEFDDGTPLQVDSKFERKPWSYGASLGLRFRWLPE